MECTTRLRALNLAHYPPTGFVNKLTMSLGAPQRSQASAGAATRTVRPLYLLALRRGRVKRTHGSPTLSNPAPRAPSSSTGINDGDAVLDRAPVADADAAEQPLRVAPRPTLTASGYSGAFAFRSPRSRPRSDR